MYVRNHINFHTAVGALFQAYDNCRDNIQEYKRKLTVTAVYLPHDLDKPSCMEEMKSIISDCSSRRKQLIIQCEANAHILWGSSENNP
jgi:hypothetical protein